MNYFCALLILALLKSITASPFSNNPCPMHCSCEVKNKVKLISCQKGTSSLTMKVSSTRYDYESIFEFGKKGNGLTINCTTFDQFAYEIAPQLNVSKLIGLFYNNCPFPVDGSLSLGFSKLYGIRFNADGTKDYGSLVKRHLNGLRSLKELRLYSNSTLNLADDAFAGLSKLIRLYLHSNRINFSALNPLSKLVKIEIGFLNGEFNLDGLRNCTELEQVNLANLEIDRLSKRIFENLPAKVDTIFFYDNKINTIDPDVFAAASKLLFIRFSGNVIKNFPSHFEITSDNFRYFQLMGDHESIPDELLSNLPKLRDVDFHCNLKSIPENLFKGSYNLNILNLTGNQLTDLPENLLANQTKLFHLYLDQNRLEVLPQNLIQNLMTKPKWVSSVLFILSFKSNRIQSISENDWRLLLEKNGEYDFANNSIVDFSVFNNFGKTFTRSKSFFIFNDNPIICDCEKIKALRKYLKNEGQVHRFSYSTNNAKCASPANLAGTPVADVPCHE